MGYTFCLNANMLININRILSFKVLNVFCFLSKSGHQQGMVWHHAVLYPCKQTWAIEFFFSHTLLHYCPKANSYSYDSYRIRNILAVMDHNDHLGRMPQVGDDGDSYAQAQVSRRTKQWVAYERKTP